MLEIMHKSKKMKNNYHKYPFDIYQENKWKKKNFRYLIYKKTKQVFSNVDLCMRL